MQRKKLPQNNNPAYLRERFVEKTQKSQKNNPLAAAEGPNCILMK
jgi:hypothetical protein